MYASGVAKDNPAAKQLNVGGLGNATRKFLKSICSEIAFRALLPKFNYRTVTIYAYLLYKLTITY